MASDKDSEPAVCPVNHSVPAGGSASSDTECPVDHNAKSTWLSMPSWVSKAGSKGVPPSATPATPMMNEDLGKDREISSIPRANAFAYNGGEGTGDAHGGAIQGTKKWVYPSEEMFYNAMKRKNWDPKAADMRIVVPIHNAVNERAWAEILEWEKLAGPSKCGGPKLVSFSGDSQKFTPRARFNTWLGYSAPFDRHDWIVDRCGKKIEYVIDFYAGKPNPQNPKMPSFFLDVRPKLSVEGARMRFMKFWGLN
ncbi:cytochrome c/c1 heme-lyase [Limtongia smithiae]|uniref:cytochrome c/c1 heme-lyase n=1 Tax=Limtongia smithiae TaxID=1125753 RepID=UPI0034CF58BE